MISLRPKVGELVFQLYGRGLHPELFEICSTRSIDRGGYTATVAITTAGHLVSWRKDGLTLTEIATSLSQPLPQKRPVRNTEKPQSRCIAEDTPTYRSVSSHRP